MICIGCRCLFPWTDPPGAVNSTIRSRFPKRRAPPRVHGAGRGGPAETQRERNPRRAASRRTVEGIQPAGRHRPCSRRTGQPMPRPDTARWTKPGARPGRWHAAGCSRVERLGHAIGQLPRPARKNPRRAVHPAQRGTCRHACSARRRDSPAQPGQSSQMDEARHRAGLVACGRCFRSPARTRAPIRHQEEGLQAARIGITCAPMRSVSR